MRWKAWERGYAPSAPRLNNFNVRVPERGSLGTRLGFEIHVSGKQVPTTHTLKPGNEANTPSASLIIDSR